MKNVIFTTIDFKALIKDQKKGSRRQIQLAEAAIEIVYSKGIENLSYEALSKKCKIARSLIYHYFPKQDDLLLFSSAFIRYNYQNFVIARMQNQKTIKDTLSAYILSALEWVDSAPKDASVWIIFFHKCTTSIKLADYNSKLVDMGTARISQVLELGIKSGELTLSEGDVGKVARHIQLLITGGLISRATEARSKEYWEVEFKQILNFCLSMV